MSEGQEKLDFVMRLSRGSLPEDFERGRRYAAELLRDHRALSDPEYRDLVSHLLILLLATQRY